MRKLHNMSKTIWCDSVSSYALGHREVQPKESAWASYGYICHSVIKWWAGLAGCLILLKTSASQVRPRSVVKIFDMDGSKYAQISVGVSTCRSLEIRGKTFCRGWMWLKGIHGFHPGTEAVAAAPAGQNAWHPTHRGSIQAAPVKQGFILVKSLLCGESTIDHLAFLVSWAFKWQVRWSSEVLHIGHWCSDWLEHMQWIELYKSSRQTYAAWQRAVKSSRQACSAMADWMCPNALASRSNVSVAPSIYISSAYKSWPAVQSGTQAALFSARLSPEDWHRIGGCSLNSNINAFLIRVSFLQWHSKTWVCF